MMFDNKEEVLLKPVDNPAGSSKLKDEVANENFKGLDGKSKQCSSKKSVCISNKSKHSSASSVARRKQLELEAAEAKAKIQMELIDLRLQTQLAIAGAEGDPSEPSGEKDHLLSEEQVHSNVEDWLENDHKKQKCPPRDYNVATNYASILPKTAMKTVNSAVPVHQLDSSTGTAERLLSRLATPRELPSFGGDCIEWLHFKSAYEESSHMCQFSDSENLWRLRKALRGDAREAVTDLLIGNTPPTVVMDALELRFGRADIIVQNLAVQLKKLQPLPSFYQKDLFNFAVKISNSVATIRALNQEDYLRSPELISAVTSKLPSTLIGKWTDYAYTHIKEARPKLELLASFLKQEAEMLSIIGISTITEHRKPPDTVFKRPTDDNKYRHKSVFATSSMETDKCKFCKKSNHSLTDCRIFKRAMRKDKWRFIKSQGLCFCCLTTRHDRNACPAPVCDIDNCGLAHHRLLHWKIPTSNSQPPAERQEPVQATSDDATVAHVSSTSDVASRSASDVMLKVIAVKLRGPNGVINTHALLDDAASVSIIDSQLADSLGLECEKSSAIKFIDAFGLEVYQSAAPKVSVHISGQDNTLYDIKLRKVSKLNLPVQNLSVINHIDCDHLMSIKDGVCKETVVPRILIGEDNYFLIAPLEMIHGSRNAPYATRCRLGWTIHGYCGRTHSSDIHVSKHIFHLAHSYDDGTHDFSELNEIIKNSFALDSIGISTVSRENTAHLRALQILDDTARYTGNSWEVGMPFKMDNFTMPHSYDNALSRQRTLLGKFRKDREYAVRYDSEIKKLFSEGYARELTENEITTTQRVWYLPHFGVQNPNKPGKLRLVFDAAAKVKGQCLNDFLLTGPDLYNSLLGIMFRFRENAIAITGDIKDMFLKIKIRPQDQHITRFLWNKDITAFNSPPTVCVMQSLIFGATCSPFIAQYIKNKNALKYEDQYPEAVDVIIQNHYMDDCVHSTSSVENAIKLISEISDIHSNGGFHIRGWSSNNKRVLENILTDDLASTAIQFKDSCNGIARTQRTLGLLWNPSDDSFSFQISLDRVPQEILSGAVPPTKAKMLSIIMSIYDIHGFLSPFLIKSKILLQNVHRSGIDWNSQISQEDHILWMKWIEELKQLQSLRIPRWYDKAGGAWTLCHSREPQPVQPPAPAPALPAPSAPIDSNSSVIHTQLHVFCDASIKAYAAVIFWRFIRSDGYINVCFAASKSRVTPLRPVSVPRLELQGALLAARLANTVQTEHKCIKPNNRYFWTDSSTVLQWIRSDPRSYKPYVAHRLGQIDELTTMSEWRYVPSKLNVADIATKDDTLPLKFGDLWFQGPEFLRRPENEWPKDLVKSTKEATSEKRCVLVTSHVLELPDENKSSSWLRLIRSTSRILYFIDKCRRKNVQMDVHIMKRAEDLVLKKCQYDTFAAEIACLQQNQPLMSNSRLLNLTPYLDTYGILRVGGRIDKTAGIVQSTARPIILDGRHRISRLLVEYYHRRALHGANEYVVNELRQRYWVINLRPTVRAVAAHCLFCKYRRAAPRPQRMADLPAVRLQHNRRPFSFTGVDFFGPMEVTIGRRRHKRYGMIFTCLTIRAIHIELTENLTTDSAIMALRRMVARRGTPMVIYSDNGTNLRGADTELRKSLEELNQDRLREDGSIRGLEWRFLPPGAPEMAGSWERMIRTVKTALKAVLKERAPQPETLLTLLAEVEALVNSRPITHVSNDPNYPEALTPNHFLIGTSSTGPPFGKYEEFDLCLRKQWRVAQRLTDMFWSRWTKEYLPTLLPRQKWTKEQQALQVGDYVIIVEPNLDRGSWRHGVVTATHAGDDKRVRIVDVRTRTGLLRRPVTRVALLTPADGSADVSTKGGGIVDDVSYNNKLNINK